jgi:capsular polysaccharide transport system permease protein
MPQQPLVKPTASSDFWRGIRVQARCIYALMIRDLMMRYGRDNIGFLWVVVEAMFLTSGVMIIWSVLRPELEHGVGIIFLAYTGYMVLTMWRHFTGAGVGLFEQNSGLLYHRYISIFDTFISRILLELAAMTASFVFVGTVLLDANLIDPPHDLGTIIVGWVAMAALAGSVGLNLAVLTEFSKTSERFIQPIQYFILPVSGAFYMVYWLPTPLQNIAWYIPTVHCYEMVRGGFAGDAIVAHYTVWYPYLWALGLFCLGFWGLGKVRNHIHFG